MKFFYFDHGNSGHELGTMTTEATIFGDKNKTTNSKDFPITGIVRKEP